MRRSVAGGRGAGAGRGIFLGKALPRIGSVALGSPQHRTPWKNFLILFAENWETRGFGWLRNTPLLRMSRCSRMLTVCLKDLRVKSSRINEKSGSHGFESTSAAKPARFTSSATMPFPGAVYGVLCFVILVP